MTVGIADARPTVAPAEARGIPVEVNLARTVPTPPNVPADIPLPLRQIVPRAREGRTGLSLIARMSRARMPHVRMRGAFRGIRALLTGMIPARTRLSPIIALRTACLARPLLLRLSAQPLPVPMRKGQRNAPTPLIEAIPNPHIAPGSTIVPTPRPRISRAPSPPRKAISPSGKTAPRCGRRGPFPIREMLLHRQRQSRETIIRVEPHTSRVRLPRPTRILRTRRQRGTILRRQLS